MMSSTIVDDKENIDNRNIHIYAEENGDGSPAKKPAAANHSRSEPASSSSACPSPVDADLLMVSPAPPSTTTMKMKTPTTTNSNNNNNNTNTNLLATPPAIKSPPPPANSENILSAFRQVATALNAEVNEVKVLASAGKAERRRRDGIPTDDYSEEELFTSPESDCCRSPVPVTFPPMPPSLLMSSGKRGPRTPLSASFHSSPQTNRTPMNYSSLSKTPTTSATSMMAASPLVRKSLLPFLSTLEEEHRDSDVDDSSAGVSSAYVAVGKDGNGGIIDDESPPDEEDEVAFDATDASFGSDDQNNSEVNGSEEILLDESEIGGFNNNDTMMMPMKEIEFDNNCSTESDDDDDSVKISHDSVVLPPTHRRRIIDDESSEDSDDKEEEEEEEECSKHSNGNGGVDILENEIDLSKLNLNDDDDDNVSNGNDDKSQSLAVDDGGKSDLPSKAHRRRIVNDEEDDDSSDDESTARSEKSEVLEDDDSKAKAEPLGDILAGGLSGLAINDSSASEEGDASFQGSAGDFSATTDNDDDSFVSDNSASVSTGSEATAEEQDDDDESVTCFDACGCWALDEEHKGDLYLSNNSDVKWPRIRLPLALYNKLFQHQRIGVQWMASLHRNKIKGGILADDMGMGKTYQVLAYLGSLMRAQTISNAIIVCPKSVVRNWEREANLILVRMCVPNASVYAVTSEMSKEKRRRVFSDAFCSSTRAPRLVVTTYGLVSNHITDLNSIANSQPDCNWSYVVLDEGHLIKNRKTKTSQDVRILSRNKETRRLLLTGTPIQNNMKELHTLFDWATSTQLLGSIQTFLNKYGDPIEEGRQRNASDWTIKKAAEMNVKLKKRLQLYFIQRLKKTEFEDKLPEKRELVVFSQLSARQRRMYEDFTASVFDGEMSSPLAAISWLKMLCGHPSLVKEASHEYTDCDADRLVKDSAKLQVLLALIQRLKRSGHRTLIFSQSTKMLDIMARIFDGTISFLRIDGSSAMKSRQQAVDRFNDPNSGIDIMLLSTKAAGVGITLTGADRAVIYDPSWNPADDAQAVDRCYRIGQKKNVTVYRFIAAGTVEEKMYEKQVHKDGIKRVVLSSDSSATRYFDKAELSDLFKLAPEGECSMMDKFNLKVGNNGTGSTGKRSFLTNHPSVVGVASHDVLYSNVSVDVDHVSPKSEEAFSRSPFQKSKLAKSKQKVQVEDLTGDTPHSDQAIKPIGGLNKTRQIRKEAKAKRDQEIEEANATFKPNSNGMVNKMFRESDSFLVDKKYAKAMSVLLHLVENEMDSIKGDEKLSLHKKIADVGSLLGFL